MRSATRTHAFMQERSPARTWLFRTIAISCNVFALLAIGCIVCMWWPTSEKEMLRRALGLPRLAELPERATSVTVDGTSNLFAMAYFLRFQASSEEIETFIERSPGLQGITPEQFTPAHKYLPYSDDRRTESRHDYFHFDSRYPWFNPVIETRGRRYEVPWDSDSCGSTVIIDDETHTVFVKATRS